MKTPLVLLASLTLLASVQADTYTVDGSHSTVMFRIKHLNVSWFYGYFNEVSGSFVIDDDPSACSFEVLVNAESVDTNNAMRDRHIKGPDFFNVGEFPEMSFKSTAVQASEDGYAITGQLSLHGVSKEITVQAAHTGSGKDPWGGFRTGFETVFTISRSEFGIDYMPDGLSDEIRLTISLEGVRQ